MIVSMLRYLSILVLIAGVVFADQASEQAAQKAGEARLALLDQGNYGESWEQASTIFKSAVTKEQWQEQIKAVHGQTGKLQSRMLKSAQYTEKLPNAPDGKYVILQYDSKFDVGPANETAILMQEKDGSWRVSGYFVKPAQ